VPKLQRSQISVLGASDHVPGRQLVQVDEPLEENVPSKQLSQLASEVMPESDEKVPSLQLMQPAAPRTEDHVPALQLRQTLILFAPDMAE
jgi:hypothetical protein